MGGKNSFAIAGLDRHSAIVLRQEWSRGQVEARLAAMRRCPLRIHIARPTSNVAVTDAGHPIGGAPLLARRNSLWKRYAHRRVARAGEAK
jgi:hypothetical protein